MLQVTGRGLNNRELDKLFAALGRSKATWRRALVLHDWLLSIGHHPDDRLCTTLIRRASVGASNNTQHAMCFRELADSHSCVLMWLAYALDAMKLCIAARSERCPRPP